jgi:Protein of unknown function (DUF3341)
MTRVTAVFESRNSLLLAIEAARRHRLTIVTAFTPAYDAAVIDAVGVPRSWAGSIACAGGVAGGLAGLLFPAWAVEQWPHVIVGGKPLLSWPTFLIISLEMALLCAAVAGAIAFVVGVRRGRHSAGTAFTDASYAVLIACPPDRGQEAAAVMRAHGASRCEAG